MPRNFPPADQCSPEDLDAIADLVVRDPSASWDLAGSREHIEALCRRYQSLAQDRTADDLRAKAAEMMVDIAALELALAAATNDLDAARRAIADREEEIARVNNERQGEVNEATAQRERADEAEARAEQLRHQLEAMAALLDQQAETRRLDDQLRSTTRAVTGRDYEVVQQDLDADLAAEPGPLHHARDQRDPEVAWHEAAAQHHRDRHAMRHVNRETEVTARDQEDKTP